MVLVLHIAAFICFLIAAGGWPTTGRVNLIGAGLACFALSLFVERL